MLGNILRNAAQMSKVGIATNIVFAATKTAGERAHQFFAQKPIQNKLNDDPQEELRDLAPSGFFPY